MELLPDLLSDALIDTLKLLPLLFLTYLLMEYIEHKGAEKMERAIRRSGRFGPAFGSLLGLVPQCGFAGAAAGLFSGRMITPGSLLAIFLATSDEMLPVMISAAAPLSTIGRVLAAKLAVALFMGFVLDALMAKRRAFDKDRVCTMCQREGCGCHEHGIWRAALNHSLKISLFIFIICLFLNAILEFSGLADMSGSILNTPVAGVLIVALVGLIPNCTPSVAITTLYLEGALGSGAMLAGLLTNAGMGLLVLYRTNPDWKENLRFTVLLYCSGVIFGLLVGLLGISF